MAKREPLLGRVCLVCGATSHLERCHLIARSELPARHEFHTKRGEHIVILCRWCHVAFDLHLGVMFTRYIPNMPIDRLRQWVIKRAVDYRPLFLARMRLKVRLLHEGIFVGR